MSDSDSEDLPSSVASRSPMESSSAISEPGSPVSVASSYSGPGTPATSDRSDTPMPGAAPPQAAPVEDPVEEPVGGQDEGEIIQLLQELAGRLVTRNEQHQALVAHVNIMTALVERMLKKERKRKRQIRRLKRRIEEIEELEVVGVILENN